MTTKQIRCMDMTSLIRQHIRRYYEKTITMDKYANVDARTEDIDILSYYDTKNFITLLSRLVDIMDNEEFICFWDEIGGHVYHFMDLPVDFDEPDNPDDHIAFK